MVDNYIIRKMVKSDIDSVMNIERTSYVSPWSEELFVEELKREYSYNYVICREGEREALGFIIFWIIIDECHILNVAVAPPMRRRGLGRRLMAECERLAEISGASYLYLEVREGNRPAKDLYRKIGFRFIGVRKGYYSDTGEDGLVMMKNIKGRDK